jgi:hypothetical protein
MPDTFSTVHRCSVEHVPGIPGISLSFASLHTTLHDKRWDEAANCLQNTPFASIDDSHQRGVMAGSNPENVEQDEAATSDQIECKEEQVVYNEEADSAEGELKDPSTEREDEGRDSHGPASPEHVGGTPSSMTNQSPSTPGPSTPAVPNTPAQHSTATTPGPLTPGSQQVPIQPYAYPPYYYPAVPGYAQHPATMPHGAHQADHLMTCATNPYQYTDVSNLGDPIPDTRRNRGGVTEPFPEKLHRMLEATEREGTSDVVSFFSHGRAFAIHKPRRFVQEIMPRFFRQTRLTSFQRQLNLYGFRRISQGPDNGGKLLSVCR